VSHGIQLELAQNWGLDRVIKLRCGILICCSAQINKSTLICFAAHFIDLK
jgi:hypothetical protein